MSRVLSKNMLEIFGVWFFKKKEPPDPLDTPWKKFGVFLKRERQLLMDRYIYLMKPLDNKKFLSTYYFKYTFSVLFHKGIIQLGIQEVTQEVT